MSAANHYTRRTALSRLLVLTAGSGVLASDVWGQDGPPVKRVTVTEFAEDTLEKALAKLRREPGERPLLAVDAANTWPYATDFNDLPAPLAESGSGGYSLRAVTDHFQLKEFDAGTVSVLAPLQMVVLNTNPGKPNPFADLQPHEALQRFMASLDKRQFALLGGPQGIGLGDLNVRQRDLFLAALPEQMSIRRMETIAMEPPPGAPEGYPRVGVRSTEQAVVLSPQQRASVRVQLTRAPQYYFQSMTNQGGYYGVGSGRMRNKPGDTWYNLSTVPSSRRDAGNVAFGVTLKQSVPNRLKTSHLAFDATALDPPVSLNGPLTINEMLARVSKATGIEFLGDRRVGVLSLWVSEPTRTARAGDVLKALCLAVTGAFRRVGSVYLLTDDVEGIAPRAARIIAWSREAQRVLQDDEEAFRKRVADEQLDSLIGYSHDDFITLSDTVRQQIDKPDTSRPIGAMRGSVSVPIESLSPEEQGKVREMASGIRTEGGIDTSKLYISANSRLRFIVPGYGAMDADSMGGMGFLIDSMLRSMAFDRNRGASFPAPTLPTGPVPLGEMPYHTLCVSEEALTSDEAAAQLTREAARRGFSTLWVMMGLNGKTTALTRAIAAGKEAKIAVGARVRLLEAESGAAEERKDRTIFGGTVAPPLLALQPGTPVIPAPREWRRVDTSESRAEIKKSLLAIADIPALASLALSQTAAPGYYAPQKLEANFTTARPEGGGFGYTTEMRLAFLRKEGVDPIDVYFSNNNPDVRRVVLQPPFFSYDRLNPPPAPANPPDANRRPNFMTSNGGRIVVSRNMGRGGDPLLAVQAFLDRWSQALYDVNAGLMADLYASLRQKRPDLALFLQSRNPEMFAYAVWFGSWDKPDALPQVERIPRGPVSATARKYSSRTLYGYRLNRPSAPPAGSRATASAKPFDELGFMRLNLADFGKGVMKEWDGLVLDLSETEPEKTLSTLTALVAPKSGTPSGTQE